ncbi:ABC transporter permease [Mycoplasma sp. CSL10166]|uniref:ABC transporter permease n=1 Tax=unclassified Mycoplasma TaxID=2683645 RepID=UPI00197BCA6D|nr:ABC transporter permease [Mycoplasma sp. CSL10166]MBN4084678.1 ABC transporter permease [Mycoplasma sp. CSL10166]
MFSQLSNLFKRHFLIFAKDKKRIFFTFMSPMIVLLCFALFARNIYIGQMPKQTPEIIKNQYADISLMIGLLSVTTFTNAISLSSVMVTDSERKILNDLYMTPVKTSVIRLSYLLFNIFLNILITTIMYLISIFWMLGNKTFIVNNQTTIPFAKGMYIWFSVIVGCILNSAIFVFIFSYVSNSAAFSALSASLSGIAGFLIGAFVPLITFPRALAEISSLIPATQISNLIKYFALKDLSFVNQSNASFEFYILLGQDIKWWGSFLYATSWITLMFTLNFVIKVPKIK